MHELERMYSSVAPKLHSYIAQLTGNRHAAEEVLQQTFLRATEHLLVSNVGLRPAWFYTVARHIWFDEVRRRRRVVPIEYIAELVDESSSPATSAERNETVNLIQQAMGHLPESYRELLFLREFEELTYQEIADVTGMSFDQVRVGIFRARQYLRRILDKEDLK